MNIPEEIHGPPIIEIRAVDMFLLRDDVEDTAENGRLGILSLFE